MAVDAPHLQAMHAGRVRARAEQERSNREAVALYRAWLVTDHSTFRDYKTMQDVHGNDHALTVAAKDLWNRSLRAIPCVPPDSRWRR